MAARRHTAHPKPKPAPQPQRLDIELYGEEGNLIESKSRAPGEEGWAHIEVSGQHRVKRVRVRVHPADE